MSTRQMARMYSHSGGGDDFSGLQDLIPSLFGKDRLSGGLTTTPQGQVQFSPYQGPSGFLGRNARSRAEQLNQIIQTQMLIQQMQEKAAMERTKEAGNQDWYRQALSEESAKERQTTGHKQAIEQKEIEAAIALLQRAGIIPTAENRNAYNLRTTAPLLNAAQLGAETTESEAGLRKDYRTSNFGKENFITGEAGRDIAPMAENEARLTGNIPPNTIRTTPGLLKLNPRLSYGATETQEVQPTTNRMMVGNTSIETQGQPKVITSYKYPPKPIPQQFRNPPAGPGLSTTPSNELSFENTQDPNALINLLRMLQQQNNPSVF